MDAVRTSTLIDQGIVTVIPALKPLLGRRVELIALDTEAGKPADTSRLSLDEFLATRPQWPVDRPSLTLENMEQAIAQGVLKSAEG